MMGQTLEVQGFGFRVAKEENRPRAIELDAQCGDAIQKLSYTVDEIGEICTEMKVILARGEFERWYESKGLTDNQAQYAMKRIRERGKAALGIIEKPEIQALEPPDDEKERKLAELKQAIRTANERLFVVEGQVAHYKEQALIAQAQAAQSPKTVEKRVEVVPQHVLDRQRELQAQKTQLQIQLEQIKKERDFYKRDLMKEREADNDRFLQGLGPVGDERIRAQFNAFSEEVVGTFRKWITKIPQDTQTFGAEEWQRLREMRRIIADFDRVLTQLQPGASSLSQQSFIIDAALVEAG